jgi:ABC-2 type transport system permease protein
MQALFTLTRRELASYFVSLTGYVVLASSIFLMGFSFYVLMANLQAQPTPMPVTELFYITQFFWLILLLATPVITMRLFAQEKFSGTYETLMTTPVSDLQVVGAKFAAAMVFYIILWLPLLGCLSIVRHYSGEPGAFDVGAILSTYLGIILLGGVFVSLGCFASAITRSQVTAAMISLVFGASLFLLAYLATQLPNSDSLPAKALGVFNLFEQMHDFARGTVDTRPVVLFLSLTTLFLFLTLRVVESRRWK